MWAGSCGDGASALGSGNRVPEEGEPQNEGLWVGVGQVCLPESCLGEWEEERARLIKASTSP